jgi:mannose-6-phosphate isomerase-like protein (cupin superfamily)
MRTAIGLVFVFLCTCCIAQSARKAEVFSNAQLRDELAKSLAQAKASGSSGATMGDYGSHTIKLSERTVSGGAEIHAHFDDIMIVEMGEATLITGGEVTDAHTSAAGETTGSAIRGGTSQSIAAGDVVHIPAGIPHQLVISQGTLYQAIVIKVKEQ